MDCTTFGTFSTKNDTISKLCQILMMTRPLIQGKNRRNINRQRVLPDENQQEGHSAARLKQGSWRPSQTTLKNADSKPFFLYHDN